MTLVTLVPAPLLSPGIDLTSQTINPTLPPSDTWTKLRVQGETKFLLPSGRSHVEAWISGDLPDDPERLAAIAEVAGIPGPTSGTQAQRIAALEAAQVKLRRNLLDLLRYKAPTWQFRLTRWDGTTGGNWTLRDARVIAPIGDWAAVAHFELFTEDDEELSVEVRHNYPVPITLDARMLHAKHEPT